MKAPAILLLVAILLVPGCGGPDDLPRLQRVVLIVCDTLSAHHLPAWGHEGIDTSVFDRLAARGVMLRHCTTPQVWTLTAHMSLFTGLEPGVHRVSASRSLPTDIPLLAERLTDAGFGVGGFRTNNGWLDETFGFDRGFDVYRKLSRTGPLEVWARDWLRERMETDPEAPALAFLHFMDVHTAPIEAEIPYRPYHHRRYFKRLAPLPMKHVKVADSVRGVGTFEQWDLAAYDLEFLRRSYDFCVENWDARRLEKALRETGSVPGMEDALIIVTSDHGEEFAEHGRYEHRSPHTEVRDVPLLMIWPGHLPAGVVIDERVSLLDLAPTICDLAGLSPAPQCQGVSLRGLLTGRSAPLVRDFFIDGNHRGRMLEDSALLGEVGGTWYSLIARCDTTGCAGSARPEKVAEVKGLYDLDADPAETRDLSAQMPEVVAELSRRLQFHLDTNAGLAEALGTWRRNETVDMSEEDRRRLRALGY